MSSSSSSDSAGGTGNWFLCSTAQEFRRALILNSLHFWPEAKKKEIFNNYQIKPNVVQSTVRKKMATGTFTHYSYRTKILKPLIKTHRKGLNTSNLAYTMSLVRGKFCKNMAFYVCLLTVLVSQGVVVKCTTAIFFLAFQKPKNKRRYITVHGEKSRQ